MLMNYFLPVSLYTEIDQFNASEKDKPERSKIHCEFALGHAVMMEGGEDLR